MEICFFFFCWSAVIFFMQSLRSERALERILMKLVLEFTFCRGP